MSAIGVLSLIVFAFISWFFAQKIQKEIAKKVGRKEQNYEPIQYEQSNLHYDQEEEEEEEEEDEVKQDRKAFGQSQSPINLVSTCGSITKLITISEFRRNPLIFDYPQKIKNCTIMNKGTTVQINIPESSKCILRTKGKSFKLQYFNFHTPCEHTIDKRPYEMEMHAVHANKYNELAVLAFIFTTKLKLKKPRLKLKESRKRIIMAAQSKLSSEPLPLIEDDDESDLESHTDTKSKRKSKKKKRHEDSGNKFLAQFWDQLPIEKTKDDIPLMKPISFDYLFETAARNYKENTKTGQIEIGMETFEYIGSLSFVSHILYIYFVYILLNLCR